MPTTILIGPEEELISHRDLAKALGRKPCTLQAWRRRGVGPKFIKLGAGVYYTRRDVRDWLESCKVKSAEEGRLLNRRRRETTATTARQEVA